MPAPRIYLTYAAQTQDESIARELEKKMIKKGWTVDSAHRLRGYKQKIGDFLPVSEAYDAVIILLSHDFIHHEYGMYELLEFFKHTAWREKLFPLPVDNLNLADSQVKLGLVKYWEDQYNQLEEQIRDLDSLANIEGLTRDLNRFNAIRMQVSELAQWLKDMNLLNLKLHQEDRYREVFSAIETRLKSAQQSHLNIMTDLGKTALPPKEKKEIMPPPAAPRPSYGFWVALAVALLILLWLVLRPFF